MTALERLTAELKQRTRWAVRHLYVMTGRYSAYNAESEIDLTADELEYVLTTAEIGFYRRVQNDVNRIIGYSTDAMTITNADKPYANISQTVSELLNRQRILYYKMVRYTLL